MFSISDIFEYMWAVEADRTESKPVEELILELKNIEKETQDNGQHS